MTEKSVVEILNSSILSQEITLKGWVRTFRSNTEN